MATWQLGGLANMSPANSSAPSQMVTPVQQYQIGPNTGELLAHAALGISDTYQQGKAATASQAFQQQLGQLYADNDTDGIRKLAAQYPDQLQAIQQGMGFTDANRNKAIGNAAMDLQLATSTGPEAVQQALIKHTDTLNGMGVSPQEAYVSYQQNPQQFRQYADLIGMHALGPEAYFNNQANQQKMAQQGQIAQANLNLRARGLDQQQSYQNAQIDQGYQRLGLDAQKNQIDLEDKRFSRAMQQGKVTADLQQRQQASLQKKQELVGAYDSQANNITGMYDTLNQVKQIPADVFNATFGFSGKINRNIAGSKEADAWSQIEQMQSQARLMGVIGMKGTGPVSDSEGQAAAKAFLALDASTSSGAARKAINNWQSVLNRQRAYLERQRPSIDSYRSQISAANQSQQPAQIQAGHTEGGYTFLGGDPSNQNSWRRN